MKKMTLLALLATLILTSCQDTTDQKVKSPELEKLRNVSDKKESISAVSIMDDFNVDSTAQEIKEDSRQRRQQPVSPLPHVDWDKKIIREANIEFELKDYKSYAAGLKDKVKSVGGYIAQESQQQSVHKIENNVTIKVPVMQFEQAVAVLTAGVDKLNQKRITSQDVTSEYIDTRSRMEAKKQVRQRYLDLLKQAKNMEEILNVQTVINGIQEEIESAAERIQYLGHSSSFSTIHISFFQVLDSKARVDGEQSFSTKVGVAFRSGWNWVSALFIGIVTVWPLLLLIFAGIFIVKRYPKPSSAGKKETGNE